MSTNSIPRVAEHPVNPLFTERWSPRAFSSESIPEAVLMQLFEAAKWSPSAFNEQPWRVVYATKPDDLKVFQSLLVDANQVWANKAPVICFVLAKKTYTQNGKPNAHAAFDTGAAWMALTIQARLLGLYTHAMAGIKYEEVYTALNIPKEEYQVICGIVIGKMGNPEELPQPIREREVLSPRKPLDEIVMQGSFKA